jgi:hypothetical protein
VVEYGILIVLCQERSFSAEFSEAISTYSLSCSGKQLYEGL